MRATWCILIQLHTGLRTEAANENLDDKRSWNSNIPRRRLDGMDSANENISNFAYKLMSCKQDSNLSLYCCGLLFDFIRVHWVETNSLHTDNSHPLVAVTNRIPNITKRKFLNSDGFLPVIHLNCQVLIHYFGPLLETLFCGLLHTGEM